MQIDKPERLALFLAAALLSSSAAAGFGDWLNTAKETLNNPAVGQAVGVSGSGLSSDRIARGLKQALEIGVEKAVALLGRNGGFLNDPQVRIPLPGGLDTLGKGLRAVGQGRLVDQFVDSMNRAAEQAVPKTLKILSATLEQMSLKDARAILNGPQDAATRYFREHSGDRLTAAIRPLVEQATRQAGVTSYYKKLVAKAGFLTPYVDMDAMDLDNYVTGRALEGLFLKMAEQERLIRENPAARTTELLKQVFSGGR